MDKKFKIRPLLFLTFFLPMLFNAAHPYAREIEITPDSQKSVAVTIYNSDLALVRDLRGIDLPEGELALAYSGISAGIKPETALFAANGVRILEQNFEFDLLTPESLLKKYTGREVRVIKKHPTTGEEHSEPAIVLSANDGVVLKIGNRIETGVPGRLAFPDVPENLRERPTLCLLARSMRAGRRDIELTYLTSGLGWHADYVAKLNGTEDTLDITGWVTLTNRSGATYRNARLQLVAGDVNRVMPRRQRVAGSYKSPMAASVERDSMAEESLLDYHLYTLGRTTTIKDRQSKQVSLLKASAVPCTKEYVLNGESFMYTRNSGTGARKIKIGVFLRTSNTKENNLGLPMPAGVVRVYKKDSAGSLQFVGEDRIDHTPEKEDLKLKLGDAFDVTAWRKQVDFRKISGFSGYNYVYEAGFELVLKNTTEKGVTVHVRESIPGDWTIKSESLPHRKVSSSIAEWSVKVPAGGSSTLTYRSLVKF